MVTVCRQISSVLSEWKTARGARVEKTERIYIINMLLSSLSFSWLVWRYSFIWYFDMVEMKGNWLKLPSYREVTTPVYKKSGLFTKKCSRIFRIRTDPIRAGKTFWRTVRGADHSFILNVRPRCLQREHSAILARKLGVFQAGRVWQNKKSDRKTNLLFSVWGECYHCLNVHSNNMGYTKQEERPRCSVFSPSVIVWNGQTNHGPLKLTLKWPLRANRPGKLLCKLRLTRHSRPPLPGAGRADCSLVPGNSKYF